MRLKSHNVVMFFVLILLQPATYRMPTLLGEAASIILHRDLYPRIDFLKVLITLLHMLINIVIKRCYICTFIYTSKAVVYPSFSGMEDVVHRLVMVNTLPTGTLCTQLIHNICRIFSECFHKVRAVPNLLGMFWEGFFVMYL